MWARALLLYKQVHVSAKAWLLYKQVHAEGGFSAKDAGKTMAQAPEQVDCTVLVVLGALQLQVEPKGWEHRFWGCC